MWAYIKNYYYVTENHDRCSFMTDEERRVYTLEYDNAVLSTLCKFGTMAEKPYFKSLLREMISHFDYILDEKKEQKQKEKVA